MSIQQVDSISTQIVVGAVLSCLLQKVKNSRFVPWMKQETWKVNRAVAIVVSGLAAVGIHLSTVHSDPGTYVITVTGLSLTTIWSTKKALMTNTDPELYRSASVSILRQSGPPVLKMDATPEQRMANAAADQELQTIKYKDRWRDLAGKDPSKRLRNSSRTLATP